MRHILTLLLSLLLALSLHGQKVLSTVELEDLQTDEDYIFPYNSWGPNRIFPVQDIDPSLRLDNGQLLFIWKPDKLSSRLRQISCYDLLLNELWSTEFELDRNEEVILLLEHGGGDSAILLTRQNEYFQNRVWIRHRMIALDQGEIKPPQGLEIIEGKFDNEVFLIQSPDRNSFATYFYGHSTQGRSPSVTYEYINMNGQAGEHATRCDRVSFTVYDWMLSTIRRDTLQVPERKNIVMGAVMDNDANFYAFHHQRKNIIGISMSPSDGSEDQLLTFREDVPDLYELEKGIEGHLPPTPGQNQQLYWVITDRKTSGRDRGINRYRVLCFDFQQKEVNTSRQVDINSTLLVAIEKQREAYNLRPLRRFDYYSIRDVIEMPDQSLWLIVQQHLQTEYPSTASPQNPYPKPTDGRIEEMVMFQFDPTGQIRQAVVVPSVQYLRNFEERMGAFYHLRVDTQENQFHIITREAAGEKYRDPDRLFYRRVDLETGLITPRVQIFEGERRNQLWIKAFTTWMTPTILTLMYMEGSEGDAQLISVDLSAEPDVEEDDHSNGR